MDPFEKNLAVLRRVDEGLARRIEDIPVGSSMEILTARSGHLTLKVDGLLLHSAYDPQREADQVIQGFMAKAREDGPILVLGLGLGYHVEKLFQVTSAPVILVEPNPEIFRLAMEKMDLAQVFSKCRWMSVGKGIEEVFAELEKESLGRGKSRVFVHGPSMKINKEYFERFMSKLEVKDVLAGLRLKILVVPPVYGGSLPIARYAANAFKKLGHQVTMIDNSIYHRPLKEIDEITSNRLHRNQLRGSLSQHLSERVMAKCLDLGPDLVFALAQAPLTPEILDRMRQFEFITAFWFVEDSREFPYWKGVAPRYSHFFAIQKKEAFDESKALGEIDFHYLPLACDPSIHRPISLSDRDRQRFSSDISFIGAGYYNRHFFFQGLLDFDFKIWGTDWNLASPLGLVVQERGRRITPREAVKIFNGTKININLHSSTYHRSVNPTGDFVNPRTFEIAGCGGFQVVDPRSHLPELFEPDQEVVCFETIEDLREKVAYYLAHADERNHIAMTGRTRAHKDHTYRKRMEQALELIVAKATPRFMALKEKAPTRENLILEAEAETELGQFLSRFKGQDHLTLESIVSEIRRGEGKLTEPEVVFLLMNEFAKYKGKAPGSSS